MGVRSRRKRKKVENPTLFVFEGSVRHFEDGTMFSLHTQVTQNEWHTIVKETIEYQIFLECLKADAFPILKEKWTKVDEWWRVQLKHAVAQMKGIDPLFIATINQDMIKINYSAKITANAAEVVNDIKKLRDAQHTFADDSNPTVSEL